MKAQKKSTRRSAETQQGPREVSVVWDTMREYWPEKIREGVEKIMHAGGLQIGDVVAMELAEVMQLLSDGLEKEDIDAVKAVSSKLRHLRVICERMGSTGDANTRAVRVPDGVFVPHPDDVEQEDLVH